MGTGDAERTPIAVLPNISLMPDNPLFPTAMRSALWAWENSTMPLTGLSAWWTAQSLHSDMGIL
jgi:hypothetical protein